MPAGFRFIDEYRNLAKDLEHEPNYLLSNFDQEVPQYMSFLHGCDITPQIKLEDTAEDQQDLFIKIMTESIIKDESFNNSTDYNTNKSCTNNFSNNSHKSDFLNNDNLIKCTTAITMSSTAPSFFSSSSSPIMNSATSTPVSAYSSANASLKSGSSFPSRTSTFFTELGGSGISLMPGTDFLDTEKPMYDLGAQEDSLEYTVLSGQPSLYDDYESITDMGKTGAVVDESKRLEEAAIIMRDTIYNDCDTLKVPYDPLMWTPEHVRKWVSWVCQRNCVADVSTQLYQIDGRTLCSMNQDMFCVFYGDSGIKLSNELELWKAANSCFPNQSYCANNNDLMSLQSHLDKTNMESSQSFTMLPCASPALSSCSSNHDSSTSTNSTHSDHSDDESLYGSQVSHTSNSARFGVDSGYNKIINKTPTGRGHKQTIHLWQFLRELLLSKDCNYGDCIRWLDRKAGVFKIEDSKKVASLWGARKNRPAMNYDKLSRSVRQYYKKGIIKKTEQSKRLVYQFCPGYM